MIKFSISNEPQNKVHDRKIDGTTWLKYSLFLSTLTTLIPCFTLWLQIILNGINYLVLVLLLQRSTSPWQLVIFLCAFITDPFSLSAGMHLFQYMVTCLIIKTGMSIFTFSSSMLQFTLCLCCVAILQIGLALIRGAEIDYMVFFSKNVVICVMYLSIPLLLLLGKRMVPYIYVQR